MTSRRANPEPTTIPVDLFLEGYPPPMRAIAERLRAVVMRATPDATERVRIGWQLIGYDLPIGPRQTAFFAWILIQPEHVHLGFTKGSFMDDRAGRLEGAGITKYARWLTFVPGESIDEDGLVQLVSEAARTIRLPRSSPWTLREVTTE